jgi:hypothetical protein
MEGDALATVGDATKMEGRETPYISADMKTHRHEGLPTVNSDKVCRCIGDDLCRDADLLAVCAIGKV